MKYPCPSCGQSTRAVNAVTLQALLSSTAQTGGLEGFRFCPTAFCEIVYFHTEDERRFTSDSVTVPVFQKSDNPERLVCYCFSHAVCEIFDEVRQSGTSDAIESITLKCRNGEDRCPETNPQGSCCLGNVRAVVKAAQEKYGTLAKPTNEEAPCCCGSSTGDKQ